MANKPPKNRGALIGSSVLLLACLIYMLTWLFSSTDADTSGNRVFICAETGKSYRHTIATGETMPIYSPFTKRNTGWAAEACYWERDPDKPGQHRAKLEPSYVLLNQFKDPNDKSKTLCPDCGHEVVGHNPMPPRELRDAARQRKGK